ncbi:MAG: 3-oxo-tetronate kinase [Burkholderiaceae bacterium]
MLLGCIADDFTGATDLANNLVRTGLRVVQTIGVPDVSASIDADAVVIALKSRTVPAAQAVAQSLAALRWLRAQGAAQIYFKVCSTFDSTERGNIGPVAEALMGALGCDFVPVCPAFPQAGRTVYKGHLFVGDVLLSDSGMRQHPLTPMTDANLVRVLQRQCHVPVGAIEHAVLAQGPAAVEARIADLSAQGVRLAIVDAIADADLMTMGRAFATLPLLVAGSGVAIGLAQNHGIQPAAAAGGLPAASGARAIVCGSCSTASNAQVDRFIADGGAAFAVDPLRLAAGDDVVGAALAFAAAHLDGESVLVYASAAPNQVAVVQRELGVERSGSLVESALATIAVGLVRAGVRRLVVAGGETSGACVQALGITQLRIGAQIDPGVPWCHAACEIAGPAGLHLALKSGNFGAPDFFRKAFEVLA